MRTILLLLALWGIYLIIRYQWRQLKANASNKSKPSPKQAANMPVVTVKCAYCATHIPKNEAIQIGSDYYCCQAHSQLENNKHV